MTTDSLSQTYVHKRRPTFRKELIESRPALAFFVITSLCVSIVMFVVMFLTFLLWIYVPNFALSFALSLAAGLLMGPTLLRGMMSIERLLPTGRHRAELERIEDRLRLGTSEDVLADLNACVALNLLLKRTEIADGYSKMLLELAPIRPEDRPERPERLIEATFCNLSYPEYHNNWRYSCFWLFQSSGSLHLSGDSLQFSGVKHELRIRLGDIVSVEVRRHPLWLKPIPLKYLDITFRVNQTDQHVYLSPGERALDTVWDINRKVDQWHDKIQLARAVAGANAR